MVTTICKDKVILDQWHPISSIDDLKNNKQGNTVLLEEELSFKRQSNEEVLIWKSSDPSKKLLQANNQLYVGLYASSNGQNSKNYAAFDLFRYYELKK